MQKPGGRRKPGRRTQSAEKGSFETHATEIGKMDRSQLEQAILGFKGRFRLDFTPDYLKKLSVNRLRHTLLAAVINSRPQK